MRILSIETSCDETGVAILEAKGDIANHSFSILANALLSQADKHKEFGGVYPSLAKREHARVLVPLLGRALKDTNFWNENKIEISDELKGELESLLIREPEMFKQLINLIENISKPDIDVIAVTEGPGLAPALWVGVNFARALSLIWNIPIIPINHMEGHIAASLLSEETRLGHVEFPALALLISGGHTELVHIKDWMNYEFVGGTRDDAVGEAFDKVARMLDLGYPGGPEISRLAREARVNNQKSRYSLPRPMLHSDNCDFSFSGLKTAVLYTLRGIEPLTDEIKREFAQEFEDAVVEILIKKTKKAIEQTGAKTLILGGGVSANTEIREAFQRLFKEEYPNSLLYIPEAHLSTDNAIMIAVAGFLRATGGSKSSFREPIAQGNLKLS